KWIWKLGTQTHGLWKEILIPKYGGWREIRNLKVKNEESLWWRDIQSIANKEDWGGNGIRVWNDRWLDNTTVKDRFPRLYDISNNKEANLEEIVLWINNRWVWKLERRCSQFEWEKELINTLIKN
ncbi:hypothetical protein PHAVU_004G096000, partial [Phaseolus vulgaris]